MTTALRRCNAILEDGEQHGGTGAFERIFQKYDKVQTSQVPAYATAAGAELRPKLCGVSTLYLVP